MAAMTMMTASSSPMRTPGLYSSPASPSTLRSPQAPRPASSSTAPPLGTSSSANANSTSWSCPDRRQPVSIVAGADGGAEAIAVRRRGSNSFRIMSTGSLVSNSPFAKRLGQVTSSPKLNDITSPTMSPTSTLGSRIPTTTITKYGGLSVGLGALNGSRRKVSGENEENRNVSVEYAYLDEHEGKVIFDGTGEGLPRSRSASPTVPFRPIRSVNPSHSTALAGSTTTGSSNAAFKPSRPAFTSTNGSHHAKSASVGSGPVSNSLFLNRAKDNEISPPLQQAPYEIAPLSHESAPFSFHTTSSSFSQPRVAPIVPRPMSSTGTPISPFSLGHRPGQTSLNGGERRFGGAAEPPPNTPPRARSATSANNGSPAPASAMSPHRRGAHSSTESETESTASRVIRRQPSAKTVTWAATEEVLEFEVDDRRASDVSYASSTSDDARYYGREQDDSTEVEEGNSSMGFEEGGSVEVHDYNSSEDEDDDGESAVSTVDELIDNIDQFMVEERGYNEFYSPSQITSDFDARPMAEALQVAAPSSTFSSSTTTTTSSGISTGEEEDEDASNYSNDDDAEGDVTQETIAAHGDSAPDASANASSSSSPWSLERPLPNFPSSNRDFLDSVLMMDSPKQSKVSISTFELPDIPGISPLMDFGDDGSAGSVVTLDMDPAVTTTITRASMSALPQASHPFSSSAYPVRSVAQSAPAQLSPAQPVRQELIGDSPILSAFNRTSAPVQPLQASPQLSRKGSVHSDAASSLSYYGSISSGSNGPIFMGRGRLDEKLSAHQAMLEALSPSSTSTGRFPDTNNSVPFIKARDFALDDDRSQTREIQAKAATKPSSATLSTGMMPTIHGSSVVQGLNIGVGSLLTPQLAHAMSSPLDRLQKGVERAEGGSVWKTGDSLLLGVAEVPKEAEESEDEEDLKTSMKNSGGRPTRRRSLSTGDAKVSETTSSTDDTPKKLELRFERRLAGIPEVEAFGMSTQSSLDDIFNSRHHSYRVREHKVVINATDSNRLTAVNKAGDLAASPAVRRKRPSNMHEINRSLSTVSVTSTASRRSKAFRGQLFVHIREVQIDGVPMPRERTNVIFSLDNGKQRVEAGRRVLEPHIAVRKEFELICSPDLVFSIDLSVGPPPPSPVPVPQVRRTPPPPPSPTKTPGSRLRALLSSPKKKAASNAKAAAATSALPPPVAVAPDPFYSFVAPDGKFASATVRFVDEALRCRHKRARITIPFSKNPALPSNRRVSGSVTIDLFYLPSISGINKAALPKSMDESIEGMRLAETSIDVTHEGVLTQMGGDCSVWRRRNMKLRANRLVPYSEVTKMSHVEIDLSVVASIEDLNATVASGGKSAANFDADDVVSTMDNSFRLVFKDDTSIDFYADTAESKKRWMKEISQAISVTGNEPVPQWALLAKRQAAKKAQ
ncbi:hypothetical protein, variant [Microbotryum lychnidis-dioicae p1A1 Lamole]|uniref:PH domain-containing protein n=1 Tax=Microbotryum lychnidis-dioicae (strain p1A1 Lamole / MvSl-1064) TaxID=683840 RepID=U5HAG7_USTV1|nr:hypothetical protein MVLG_04194 [Microbotryum lychnidis-dioicae p1A1 Lamole]KDE05397.1 hypothetical protein, variant [Microbotryum lychnidis-dioicae p1A1 Lamole]|eukprot:KDE05396.1 hypothetical protein MVLG_04194 [Microbotryum lychnidis-dioicae p1A1 Lamole]